MGNIIHRPQYRGKVYDLEVEDDHSFFAGGIAVHNCAMVPVVRGATWTQDVESGRDWYARLPDDVQRRMAGDRLWLALKDNPALWSSVSKAYDDDVFGTMLREASARELIADSAGYQRLAQRAAGLPMNGVSAAQAAVTVAETRVG